MAYNEDFVRNFIESLPQTNEIAFDIGACLGTYAKLMSPKFAYVFAFEACPNTNFQYLVPSLKEYPNITVINAAISDKVGKTKLYTTEWTNGAGKGGNSISDRIVAAKKYGHSPSNFIEVECVTIDMFVRHHKIQNLGLIKMDIEGAENFVWNGALETLTTKKLNILLEVHQEVDYPRLFGFFEQLGYKIFDDVGNKAKMFFPDNHYLITNRS